jgi:hypothetical protein
MVFSLPGRPAVRDRAPKTAICGVSLIPRPCGVRPKYASVLRIEKFSLCCENFRNSGKGFICHYARFPAASCESHAIVFGGLASGHF